MKASTVPRVLALMIAMLPCTVLADGNCRVIEFKDHYDVECVGDHSLSASSQAAAPETNIQTQPVYPPVQPLYDDSSKEVKVVNTSRSFGVYRPRSKP